MKKSINQKILYSATRVICIPLALPIWSLFSDSMNLSHLQTKASFTLILAAYLAATLGQHLASLATLVRISAVSHAVVASLKRVCVILLSILFFGNKWSLINGMGLVLSSFAVWRFTAPRVQIKEIQAEEVKLISYLAA
jgi:uncharacterized membrane protein